KSRVGTPWAVDGRLTGKIGAQPVGAPQKQVHASRPRSRPVLPLVCADPHVVESVVIHVTRIGDGTAKIGICTVRSINGHDGAHLWPLSVAIDDVHAPCRPTLARPTLLCADDDVAIAVPIDVRQR